MKKTLSLQILPETLAVSRLDPSAAVPDWAFRGTFFTVSKTTEELSIVCAQSHIPEGVKSEKNWRCFKVEGPIDFGLTGVLASLTEPLAQAEISIFAVSTFDTDYLLVKEKNFEKAIETLSRVGHKIQGRS